MAKPRWEVSFSTYLAGRSHLDGVDRLANEMERKWGVGRLRLLVSAELRGKFDSQRAKLNDAILTGEVADLERESGRMVKAWMALDRAAEAAGAFPVSAGIWEAALPDGRVLALLNENTDISQVSREGRHVEVWTIDEIARVVAAFPEIGKAKEVWPGARVESVRREIRDPLEEFGRDELNDDIPF